MGGKRRVKMGKLKKINEKKKKNEMGKEKRTKSRMGKEGNKLVKKRKNGKWKKNNLRKKE